jgi:hypothetical protein
MKVSSFSGDVPFAHRFAQKIPMPKIGIDEAYRSIINRLRQYSATSIIDAALYMLWNPPIDPLEELKSAPWLTLLIVKWALQDQRVNLRIGRAIPIAEFDAIRQKLWDLPGQVRDDAPKNIYLMLRSWMHVQIEFQRKESRNFMRWAALYARMPKGSAERRQFREAFGMEPDEFLVLSFALYAAVLNGDVPFSRDWMTPLRAKYGQKIDRIFDVLTRDVVGLREELQKDAAQRIRGKNELYEFPYLKRFPLLQLRNGQIHCWHRLVFARGIEDIVHLRLSDLFDAKYTQSFSRVFESYVTELAQESGLRMMDEAEYKRIAGAQMPSVEVILDGDADCNLFVEAKMSKFEDDTILEDSPVWAHRKMRRVREALEQGWKVGKTVRENPTLAARFGKRQDFLLIVTSRELYIGGGQALQRLVPPDARGYPDEDTELRMPLSNVFVMGIEEFEHLMGAVRTNKIELPQLLRDAAAANQDGSTSRIFFSDFFSKYVRDTGWTRPQLLLDAQKRVDAYIAEAGQFFLENGAVSAP